MIILKPTERGFMRGEFVDRFGAKCSIQKSSMATEDCIWLGCDHEIVDQHGNQCGARMHLTREMAMDLVTHLQHFIETGDLT